MKNKVIIDTDEVLKAFKKAIKEEKIEKTIEVTYLDKDGSVKRFKSKIR